MANSVDILARGIATSAFTKAEETKIVLERDINAINSKISSAASSTNKLMDKEYIDDSINSMAAYYITKNAQGDQFATRAELMSAQTFYSGGVVRVPSKNDYCIVAADETHDNSVTRYIYNSQWEYQYTVNESPMSAAQLAALNSGITAQDVAKINSFDQNKLPLVPNLTLYDQIYYQQAKTSGIGGTKLMPLSPSNIANTIIQRNSNGRAQITDPVNDGDIANKGYVDNCKKETDEKINNLKPYYIGIEFGYGLTLTNEEYKNIVNAFNTYNKLVYYIKDNDNDAENIIMTAVSIDMDNIITFCGFCDKTLYISKSNYDYYEEDVWEIPVPQEYDISNYYNKNETKFEIANGFKENYITTGQKSGTTLGSNATAEGYQSTASANRAHAEGDRTTASGVYGSHAEGRETIASGVNGSHAEGYATLAKSAASHAEGRGTIASSSYGAHAEGVFNIEDTHATYAHIVGGGTADDRHNIYTLDWQGNGTFAGSVSSQGADYAEYFEWLDGNPTGEDRIGRLVTLSGEKIKYAESGDDILGITSGTVAVLGDNYESEWQGKYQKDNFGRVLFEDYEYTDTKIDPETGEEIEVIKQDIKPKLNPDYDPETEYIPRSKRQEWETVGMLGKLFVEDDGSCEINGYVTVAENGIATASVEKTNIRVLERTKNNIIRVLLK